MVEVKQKIWLERNGKLVFGHGRKLLLEAIEECGSINAAAKKLRMSYRAAWGRLKTTEQRLGIPLVQIKTPGGSAHLTDAARELIDKFDTLERETEAFIKVRGQQLVFSVPGEREESS
jgi:molybdate transport system regulatory protein